MEQSDLRLITKASETQTYPDTVLFHCPLTLNGISVFEQRGVLWLH